MKTILEESLYALINNDQLAIKDAVFQFDERGWSTWWTLEINGKTTFLELFHKNNSIEITRLNKKSRFKKTYSFEEYEHLMIKSSKNIGIYYK